MTAVALVRRDDHDRFAAAAQFRDDPGRPPAEAADDGVPAAEA
jgi:hypothetical protein